MKTYIYISAYLCCLVTNISVHVLYFLYTFFSLLICEAEHSALPSNCKHTSAESKKREKISRDETCMFNLV